MTATIETSQALGPQAAADELAIARLKRTLTDLFGEVDNLDRHLALMDSRGVRHAAEIADLVHPGDPQMLFGIVRHVIRTQSLEGAPDPDLEGWLAAGCPEDLDLGFAWRILNVSRYGNDLLPEEPRRDPVSPAMTRMDVIVSDWLDDLDTFARVYAKSELIIELQRSGLPPVTA